MKLLVAISGFKGNYNDGNIIFLLAWKRFLDRHAAELDCDFIFVNNRFDPSYFQAQVAPYDTFDLVCPVSVPFDTDATYWPMAKLGSNYDYMMRVDHDAYPSKAQFQSFIDFLKQNPGVDVVTATNYPRTIESGNQVPGFLDNREILLEERSAWHWEPWGYPTQNSDLLIMSQPFFRRCLKRYYSHPKVRANIRGGYLCPFDSNFLDYGDICDVLGYEEKRWSGTRPTTVRIDGSINTDFWTFMCAEKMTVAGITEEGGRSFLTKNHTIRYGEAMAFDDFDSVRDRVNIAYPYDLNVVAPYFHIGNGYVSECYFDVPESRERSGFFMPQFQGEGFGYYPAHFSIVRALTLLSGDAMLTDRLNTRMANLFAEYGVDEQKFNEFANKVWQFYKPAISEYL